MFIMQTKWCASRLLWLAGALFFGCQSGDLDVGQAVINPQELQIQSIDSVTVQTATVMVPDSFVTSTDTSILVGRWSDTQTGQLVARGFTSVDYVTNALQGQTGLRLDSLVLELGYSFAYGDTATAFTLGVYPLRQPLVQQAYYNTGSAAYETTPLGTKTVILHPNSGTRQIRFRVADAVAQAFYAKLISGDINDATTLAEFWPGFAFAGQSATNVLVGFSANQASSLRLYYHTTDIDRTAASVRFPISQTHFSQLRNDRSGSALQPLQRQADQVSSKQTSNATFVAAGGFLRTRIELPYLGQFDKPELFAGLNSAILSIQPIRRDRNDNTPPPAQLSLYETNSQNEIIAVVPAGSTGASATIANYLYDPNALELNDVYQFDLTQYVGQIIRRQIPNRPLLLTIPVAQPDLRTLVRRVTLGDQNRSTDRVKLQLFMTSGN